MFTIIIKYALNKNCFMKVIYNLIGMLYLVFITSDAYPQTPNYLPTSNLVAWYPFTGNALDSSGNNRHLTSSGAPTLTTDRFNQANRAFNFNHSQSQYFYNTNFPTTYNSYTITAWVKISNVINYPAITGSTAGTSLILGQTGCNSTNCNVDIITSIGFNTHLNGSQFLFSARHRNSTGVYLGTGSHNINNNWNFIAEVWNGNKVYLYLNNNLIDSATTSGISPLTSSFYIGAGYFNRVYYYYSGKIDDVGVWSRALTNQEISNIYNYSVLPVKWIGFNAIQSKDHVELNWTTATEINNREFILERSTDAINYTRVGQLRGAGTNYTPIKYRFIDSNSFTNFNKLFYRIKQVDYNGNFEYSKVVSVLANQQIDKSLTIESINPNPFIQELNLELKNINEGSVTIYVTDMSGRLQYTNTLSCIQGNNTINISNLSELAKGVYILNISNAGKIVQQKLVKL